MIQQRPNACHGIDCILLLLLLLQLLRRPLLTQAGLPLTATVLQEHLRRPCCCCFYHHRLIWKQAF